MAGIMKAGGGSELLRKPSWLMRAERGLWSWAVMSLVVGLIALSAFTWLAFVNAPLTDESARTARTVVIGAALVHLMLMGLMLAPATSELRRKVPLSAMRMRKVKSSARGSANAAKFFVWGALGDAGLVFTLLAFLLGLFVVDVFQASGSAVTVMLVIGLSLFMAMAFFLFFGVLFRLVAAESVILKD